MRRVFLKMNKVKNPSKSKKIESGKVYKKQNGIWEISNRLSWVVRELNMNGKFKYILTWVNHFSKYAWALPIKNKVAVTVRNTISQVFIRKYPRILQTDKGKEIVNKVLSTYLDNIEVEHEIGTPYHPQNQGAIEAFNK